MISLYKVKRLFQRKALVLMYHRIAELASDPWQLAVSPANFAQQLEVLQKLGRLLPVNELVSALGRKSISGSAICITFDDGYRDNFFSARPLLEKYNCPASFFIATRYTDREQQFWWDELENILLHSARLPTNFSMLINDQEVSCKLSDDGVLTPNDQGRHKSWIWPGEPPTKRCELYLAIWERLKPLPYDQLQAVLEKVKTWAGVNGPGSADNFPMNSSQINEILDHPLLDIGLHTATHPALSFHAYETQHAEIKSCREFLETRFQRTMTTIAYPYGDYNNTTLEIVKELRLKAAFTTEERVVTNSDDQYRLGRFQVKDWNGEEFEKQLYKWMKYY